jgi:hypothetical protein
VPDPNSLRGYRNALFVRLGPGRIISFRPPLSGCIDAAARRPEARPLGTVRPPFVPHLCVRAYPYPGAWVLALKHAHLLTQGDELKSEIMPRAEERSEPPKET